MITWIAIIVAVILAIALCVVIVMWSIRGRLILKLNRENAQWAISGRDSNLDAINESKKRQRFEKEANCLRIELESRDLLEASLRAELIESQQAATAYDEWKKGADCKLASQAESIRSYGLQIEDKDAEIERLRTNQQGCYYKIDVLNSEIERLSEFTNEESRAAELIGPRLCGDLNRP